MQLISTGVTLKIEFEFSFSFFFFYVNSETTLKNLKDRSKKARKKVNSYNKIK